METSWQDEENMTSAEMRTLSAEKELEFDKY